VVTATAQTVRPGQDGYPGTGGNFGAAVTGADFDHDGHADLAVGSPRGGPAGEEEHRVVGEALVAYGTAAGIGPVGAQILRGVQTDDSIENDQFGTAVSPVNFQSDGHPDLAVGAPYDFYDFYGSVNVFLASGGPLSLSDHRISQYDLPAATISNRDGFGYSLAGWAP
jgi:hypothetical protein